VSPLSSPTGSVTCGPPLRITSGRATGWPTPCGRPGTSTALVDIPGLEDLLGERPPGTIASLVEFGVVQRVGGGPAPSYRIASPGLFRVMLALQASGIDIETAVRAGDVLRRRLGAAARELVDYFSRRAGRGFGRNSAPDEIGAALDALRPLAGEAARLMFARQIERAIRDRTAPRGSRRWHGRRRRRGRSGG